jgi:lipid II:glycine glycyltransferase (peptidoglycan interpeptide bridge formation enzyme)
VILKPLDNLDEFCAKSEKMAGVFAGKKWLSVYGDQLHLVGIYKDEKQMIGGFFFLKTKKMGLSFLKLPPYTPHCGLFFESESRNPSSQNSFTKEVMLEVCKYISEQKCFITVLAFPFYIKDLQQFTWNNYKVIPNYTYQLQLSGTIDEIKNNFDSKHRNAINKAQKEGVEVACNAVPKEEVFSFFMQSLNNAGANVYEAELKKILLEFSDPSNAFTLSASLNDRTLGMVHCIFDNKTCYYLLGGLAKGENVQGVNNLLVLKSIEKAKKLGCGIFDFEGSMLKGVEKFFRGFGPELVPYFTVNKAGLFIELLLKFYKRNIF